MARPERFELPTYSSGGCRSIQLSYGRAISKVYMQNAELSTQHRSLSEEHLPAVSLPATVAAITPAPAAIAKSSSSATRSFCFWSRLIDIQLSSAKLTTIECRDRFLAVFRVRHLHEPKPTRTSGITVGHDTDAVNLSVSAKQLPQFFF